MVVLCHPMSDRFDHTLEHTLKTKPDEPAPDVVTPVRRIELITGASRRRQWSEDDRLRIIVESLMPGANVSEVARRNGLSPQQLFGWRRKARAIMAEGVDNASGSGAVSGRAVSAAAGAQSGWSRPSNGEGSSVERVHAFAPVVVAQTPCPRTSAAAPPAPPAPPAPQSPPSPPPASGRIGIAIGDATVCVVGRVEPAMLATVLRAVRRTS